MNVPKTSSCPVCGGLCGQTRDIVLLPRPRPAPRRQGTLGAQFAVEAYCKACGMVPVMRRDGITVCGRCHQPIED